MHEISLMMNLLEVVVKTAEREGGGKVSTIHLRIGEMSGVSIEALNFAFDVLSKGTVAENGKLEVERIPFKIRCKSCRIESELEEFSLRCPECNSAEIEMLSGREMEIDYILMDDSLSNPDEDSCRCGTGG